VQSVRGWNMTPAMRVNIDKKKGRLEKAVDRMF
jgi:hypothetical protein